jgi:quercetin dioxygenase-like cupin family protein
MSEPKQDPMAGRVVRFDDLKQHGTAVAFIDSVLPGHYRMNYAVLGDTAVENADFRPMIEAPHRFQLGIFQAPPGNGPAWHTHEYVELFVPLTGRWRFYYGTDPDGATRPDGEIVLGPWDAISFPPGLWRGFENVDEQNAWGLAVLDPHDPFVFKDPHWPDWLIRRAAEHGLTADDAGRMVKPDNFDEMERQVASQIDGAMPVR